MNNSMSTYKWQEALGCLCYINDVQIRDSLRQLLIESYSCMEDSEYIAKEIQNRFEISMKCISSVVVDRLYIDCSIFTLVSFLIYYNLEEKEFENGFNDINFNSSCKLINCLKENGCNYAIPVVINILTKVLNNKVENSLDEKDVVLKSTANIIVAIYSKNYKMLKEN